MATEQTAKQAEAKQPGYAKFWDMSLGGNDTSHEIPHGFARCISRLVYVVVRLLFRYRVENQHIIRAFQGKRTGAVLVAPHVSYFDVVALFLSVRPKQWVRLVARDSLFRAGGGILGQIIARVGAFPIKRETADRTAIKRATRNLKNGENIGLFPEGTRRGKGKKVPSLHGGAALMARMGKAPLIPVGICNVDKIKEPNKGYRLVPVTVVFGEPIDVGSFDFLDKEDRLEGCTWYVMREAFALSHQIQPQEVDMTSLFPESKDYSAVFAHHPISRVDLASLEAFEPSEKAG